ncbi:hypothetical protein FPQ18DRAFT_384286 [Pyronema domesticum]|nr:hypothetical protein FPQ18DRAFT_384286 [Pyronema domesticum]
MPYHSNQVSMNHYYPGPDGYVLQHSHHQNTEQGIRTCESFYQPIHAAPRATYPHDHQGLYGQAGLTGHHCVSHQSGAPGYAVDGYKQTGGLPSLSAQVSAIIPIDPRLLEIDAHQRAARGLAPFTPIIMGLPFAPVASAGVPASGSLGGSAAVKRKRASAPRKKPVAAAFPTGQAATVPAAPKQWKRKAKVDLPSLAASASAPSVAEPAARMAAPAGKRRKNVPVAATNNVQISSADPVSAPAILRSWSVFVPVPAYYQAADNASAGDPDAAP